MAMSPETCTNLEEFPIFAVVNFYTVDGECGGTAELQYDRFNSDGVTCVFQPWTQERTAWEFGRDLLIDAFEPPDDAQKVTGNVEITEHFDERYMRIRLSNPYASAATYLFERDELRTFLDATIAEVDPNDDALREVLLEGAINAFLDRVGGYRGPEPEEPYVTA